MKTAYYDLSGFELFFTERIEASGLRLPVDTQIKKLFEEMKMLYTHTTIFAPVFGKCAGFQTVRYAFYCLPLLNNVKDVIYKMGTFKTVVIQF